MSHSTVLVIGEDPEALLAPYDENLEAEPYRDYEEGNAEEYWWVSSVRRGAEHLRNGTGLAPEDRRSIVAGRPEATVAQQIAKYTEDAECSAKLGEHPTWETVVRLYGEKYPPGEDGNERLLYEPESGRAYRMSTYNPRSKWDWYQLGGRWTGFFDLRSGGLGTVGSPGLITPLAANGRVDQARKRDIDWDAMRDDAARNATEEYAKVAAAVSGHEPIVRWSVVREERFPGDIDKARGWYHAQPGVRALHAAGLYADDPVEYWCLDREDPHKAFVERQRASAGMTFALLDDEGWHERGHMGWFGMVSNETDDWPQTWTRLVDRAPDDALFSVYDVHI